MGRIITLNKVNYELNNSNTLYYIIKTKNKTRGYILLIAYFERLDTVKPITEGNRKYFCDITTNTKKIAYMSSSYSTVLCFTS